MPSLEFLMSCAQFGLGWGPCGHCGVADVFDNSRNYNGTFFCCKAECTAAGLAKLQQDEERLLALAERRRKEQEEWEAQLAAERRRLEEEDAAALKRWQEAEDQQRLENEKWEERWAAYEQQWQIRIRQALRQSYRCECCNGETSRLRLKNGELLCGICERLPSRA